MACCSIHFFILCTFFVLQIFEIESASVQSENEKLNIAIIGAGASGLSSARHAVAQGHTVTVYEQNEELGGVWVYTDKTGKDEYGLNIHTALYQGLRFPVFFFFWRFKLFRHLFF